MSTATALLFPGQGSQHANMRELVSVERPDLLALAQQLLGVDPFDRLREGTAYLQPAIYCTSIANLERLSKVPEFYAGHSLGELSALVAAKAIGVEDGLRLVVTRGRLMQRVEDDGGEGAMLAVGMGMEPAARLAASLGLAVANDNSPEQVVLSGPAEAIERARAEVKSRGLFAFRLRVKGAFHSPALEPVVEEFRAALDAIEVRPPRRPVFSGVTVREFDDVRRQLAEALTHGVRWRELLLTLRARGVSRFIEVPPGRVLTALVQKTLPEVDAYAAASNG